MPDLVLAVAHHMLAFLLVAVLATEFVLVREGLRAVDLPLLARIDASYGALAAGLDMVGAGRVVFGLKGWEYYIHSWVFWAKMAAFVAVGLLSIPPTLRIIGWRRANRDAAETIPAAEIQAMRRLLMAEATVLLLVPIFAAMMARGVGD